MRKLLPFIWLILFGGILLAQELTERRLALRQLVERAASEDAKALYDLARLHETGYDSIPVDSTRSMGLYMLSANKGYAPARNYIGFRYYTGDGVRQDLDSALYWIRLAAEEGDITAAANLGYLLTEGEGVKHQEDEAIKWLSVASEAGVNGAQIKLTELKEKEWKELPADTLLTTGIKYYVGKSPIVGTRMLELAAQKQNPKAMAVLGDAYSKGLGVPYNHQKSIDYFYEAAKMGEPSAQFIIAEMLEFFPDGIPVDASGEETGADYWYEKAKEGGVTDSEKAYELLFSVP